MKVAEQKLKEAGLPVNEENAFIVATCADKGILYLQGKAKVNGVRKVTPKVAGNACKVTVDGTPFNVSFESDNVAVVNGKRYNIGVGAADAKATATPAAKPAAGGAGTTLNSPLPGAVLRLSVKDGDTVKEGQEVLVLEAMKMETVVSATATGTVHFLVKQGDQVQTGHPLAEIK